MEKIEAVLDRLEKTKILVLGDLILDQYIWGEVNRISPEAPIPVVEVVEESFSLGGAANVANNLRALGASVEICGVVGDDPHGRRLLEMLDRQGIDGGSVVRDEARPTILKTRIIAHKQQVVRVDREDARPVEGPLLGAIKTRLAAVLPEVDAVIVEDYGKGVIHGELLRDLVPRAREAGKIVTVDPKTEHFESYRGVTALTPNRQEAQEAVGVRITDQRSLFEAGRLLLERLACRAVLITLGERGMCLFEQDGAPFEIPARAHEVYDVSGAGDTVIAVFTAALVAGAPFREAALLSNLAGSLVVEKIGTAVVTREEIQDRIRDIAS